MRLRTFVLSLSALVTLLFFAGTLLIVERSFEKAISESARQNSANLAQLTFSSMYQVMSTGWKRDDTAISRSTPRRRAHGADFGGAWARRYGPSNTALRLRSRWIQRFPHSQRMSPQSTWIWQSIDSEIDSVTHKHPLAEER